MDTALQRKLVNSTYILSFRINLLPSWQNWYHLSILLIIMFFAIFASISAFHVCKFCFRSFPWLLFKGKTMQKKKILVNDNEPIMTNIYISQLSLKNKSENMRSLASSFTKFSCVCHMHYVSKLNLDNVFRRFANF